MDTTNLEIENLDELSEEEREALLAFVRDSLEREERSALLYDFVTRSGDKTLIDAKEILSVGEIADRFTAFKSNYERGQAGPEEDRLLASFAEDPAEEQDHGIDAVDFDLPDPTVVPSESEIEGESHEDAAFSEERPPEEPPEDPQTTSEEQAPKHDESSQGRDPLLDDFGSDPEHADDQVFNEDADSVQNVGESTDSESIRREHNENVRLRQLEEENQALRQEMMKMASGGGGGGGGESPSLLDKMLTGAGNLIEGAATGTGSLARAAGKGAEDFLSNKSMPGAEASMKAISGKPEDTFTRDARAELSGEPVEPVADFRAHLERKLATENQQSVSARLQAMAASRFKSTRGSVVDLMNNLDERRLSAQEVAPGYALGDVISSAINGTESEQRMGRALINKEIQPQSVVDELEVMGTQYQRLGDYLDDIEQSTEKLGWDKEQVVDEILTPVQQWMETRQEEDAAVFDTAELLDVDQPELSEEEVAKRRELAEELAKKIKALIDKLLGRSQDESRVVSMDR